MMTCLWVIRGLVVAVWLLSICHRIRFRRLAQQRAGDNFGSFCTSFSLEVPIGVIHAVYERFQSWTGVSDFPVRAEDSIEDVYKMGECLEDELWFILTECGREMLPDGKLAPFVPLL